MRDGRYAVGQRGGRSQTALLDDHAEWNGQLIGWSKYRWTGTLEKRAGQWVIVQMHFSFPKD